jgi:hypothetical protein
MQELALYDPSRKPASWMQIIRPNQYVVFITDTAGQERRPDGSRVSPAEPSKCYAFDSLAEARRFAEQTAKVARGVRCAIYDSSGRANSPIITAGDDAREPLRLLAYAALLFIIACALFAADWVARRQVTLATMMGIALLLSSGWIMFWSLGVLQGAGRLKLPVGAEQKLRAMVKAQGGSA